MTHFSPILIDREQRLPRFHYTDEAFFTRAQIEAIGAYAKAKRADYKAKVIAQPFVPDWRQLANDYWNIETLTAECLDALDGEVMEPEPQARLYEAMERLHCDGIWYPFQFPDQFCVGRG